MGCYVAQQHVESRTQRVQRIELRLVPQYVSCHVYANERIETLTRNVNETAEFSSVTKFDWSNELR